MQRRARARTARAGSFSLTAGRSWASGHLESGERASGAERTAPARVGRGTMARERVERGADTSPASSQPSLSMAEIRQLIPLMNGSDIEEIAIEREADGLKLTLRKPASAAAPIVAADGEFDAYEPPDPSNASSDSQQPHVVEISAPLVGIFLASMQPADAPLVSVCGEVTNSTQAPSGPRYFSLKDERATLGCVLFRGSGGYVPPLRNGISIVAHGRFSVFEQRGAYQFYVDAVEAAGIGELHLRFEELKARLEAEGLFAPERKRVLPPCPAVVGALTPPPAAPRPPLPRAAAP